MAVEGPMPTRVVIDSDTAILIASGEIRPDPSVELLAPTLLRSHVLESLFAQVRNGDLDETEALALNARFAKLRFRFLGDAVMRRQAWTVASLQGLGTTHAAEYVALTQLQADALATMNAQLIEAADGLVEIIDPRALHTPP